MEEDDAVYKSLVEKLPVPSPKESRLPGRRLTCMALLVALGGPFPFGYQLVITNPSQDAFLDFVNSSHSRLTGEQLDGTRLKNIWGMIVALFFVGMTVGAIQIRYISHSFGRKLGIQIAHVIQIISCTITILSYFKNDYFLFGFARFALGYSISLALGIVPMFITECSPKSCRGLTSMASGIMIQSGLTIGAIVAMPQVLGSSENWWIMFACHMALTTIVFLLVPFIKDSPGHLIGKGKSAAAQLSLEFYYEKRNSPAIFAQLEEERQENSKNLGLVAIWKNPDARRGTLVGSVVMVAMVMSGIAVMNAFACDILIFVGLNHFQAAIGNVFICLMTVLGILTSSPFIDHFGRRPLLLSTFSFITVLNVVVAVLMWGFEITKAKWIGFSLLGAIALFNFVFAAGPGPLSLFVTGELVGQHARGAACTWVSVFMCVSRTVLLMAFFPIEAALGRPLAYFLLFVPSMVIGVVLMYFHLPESKNRTPQQVRLAYDDLPSILKKERNPVLIQ